MEDYVFVLGRDRELSVAEIISFLSARGIEHKINYIKNNIFLVSLPDLDFLDIVNRLGGTVKIGKLICDANKLGDNFDGFLNNVTKNKLFFSLSAYNNPKPLNKINMEFKAKFREIGLKFSTRVFVNEDSPKRLLKNKKYDTLDVILFKNSIARTIAISNPLKYKEFEKRPENDFMRSTSSRLAKILINLSKVKENQTLLDPFCGIGSILQQAILMNINVIGVDKDEKSVKQTIKNLEWTKKNFKANANFNVLNGDSTYIKNILKNRKFDVIVTEPYLGPYIKKKLSTNESLKLHNQLEIIYKRFFESLTTILEKETIIVILFPKFKTKEGKIVDLDINKLLNNNFKISNISEFVNIPLIYGISNKLIRCIYVLNYVKIR